MTFYIWKYVWFILDEIFLGNKNRVLIDADLWLLFFVYMTI